MSSEGGSETTGKAPDLVASVDRAEAPQREESITAAGERPPAPAEEGEVHAEPSLRAEERDADEAGPAGVSESDEPSGGFQPDGDDRGPADDDSEGAERLGDEEALLRIVDAEFEELERELERILTVPEEWGQHSLETLLKLKEQWSARIKARAGDRPDWRQRLDKVFAAVVEKMLRESHSEDMAGDVKFNVRPDALERHGGPLVDAVLNSLGEMLAGKLKEVIESKIAPALLQQSADEAGAAAPEGSDAVEPTRASQEASAPSTGQASDATVAGAQRRSRQGRRRGKRRRSGRGGGQRGKKGVKGKVRKIRPNPIRVARARQQASKAEPSPAAERSEPEAAQPATGQQAVDVNIDLANILKSWIKPKPKPEPEGSSQSGSDGGEE